ncbi:M17 family peptidase N-terminal domain-containing protein [Paludisphaera soli]|uniref:M17 family peptidase N-terminal domain-containing protein n=1 Tax=Paludisphaera soli TaxID=2712865 RepID=UPI0013EA50E1|nr:M17 family peptidase N-terminal domain-containing protein [Paludisphaera soli]
MKPRVRSAAALAVVLALAGSAAAQEVRETTLNAPRGLPVKVRMEGPYTAEAMLQVVCYFQHEATGDFARGAPVELDRRLGGVIAALRDRGEFRGDALETVLIVPPAGTIPAKGLLLVGLGDRGRLSAGLLEQVGKASLREAARLRAATVAFAPLVRDQGDDTLSAGEVERAVTRGVFLAYDTEKRLQEQGLAPAWTLESWEVEAGPDYYDDTIAGVKKAIDEAKAALAARDAKPYRTKAD